MTDTKDRPILFSGPMVRAILAGTKTQTRRALGGPNADIAGDYELRGLQDYPDGTTRAVFDHHAEEPFSVRCPYGKPGDRLWVRETHYRFGHWEPAHGARTKAGRQKWAFVADSGEVRFDAPTDCVVRLGRHHKDPSTPAWHRRLGRFMPRSFARTILQVTEIRVERLHDISEADIIAEGVTVPVAAEMTGIPWSDLPTLHHAWRAGWEHINGNESWNADPWVWVVSFRRVEQ